MIKFQAFAEDIRGSVAMIFALVLLPILLMVGVGIDYSRIASNKSEMQTVVQNAVETYPNLRAERIDAARQIEAMINANSGRNTADVTISIHQDKMRIEAKDHIDTPMLSTIGQPKSEFTASVEVEAGGASGTTSNKRPELSRKEFDDALDAEFDRALKKAGLDGNLNRLSPAQRERLKRKLKRELRSAGVRFK